MCIAPPYVPPPISFFAVAHAEEIATLDSPQDREAYARLKAKEYEINEEAFVKTLSCESMGFSWNDQSLVPDPVGPNGKENSWGIAQFNLPSDLKTFSGDEITKEIALDPKQAIDASAFNFSIGNQRRWSCFNKYY